jgi:hypothetical protein
MDFQYSDYISNCIKIDRMVLRHFAVIDINSNIIGGQFGQFIGTVCETLNGSLEQADGNYPPQIRVQANRGWMNIHKSDR